MIQYPKLEVIILPEKNQPILFDRQIIAPFVLNDAYIRRILERKQMLQPDSYWSRCLLNANLQPVVKNIAHLCPFVKNGLYENKKVHYVFFERASTQYHSIETLQLFGVNEKDFVWKIILSE